MKEQWSQKVSESDSLSQAIKEIDSEKTRLLDEAPWPVEGLRYSEEGALVLNGVPFSQASTAEKIRTSVQMECLPIRNCGCW